MTAITAEEMSIYRATAQQRKHRQEIALRERRALALAVARQLAAMLRTRFGATRVILFGSSTHPHWYSMTSDIDLAVWGVSPTQFYMAVACCQDADPRFSIDLVDMSDCPASLHEVILHEGIEL